jgi:hypothetical protein
LRYRDVKDGLKSDKEVVKIPVYPEMKEVDPAACKGNIPYYSFIDIETVKVLRDYLLDRKTIFGGIEGSEPLFCSDSNQIPTEKQRTVIVSKNGLARMVKRAARKAGLMQWKDVTPHSLRKAFESVLRNNRLDPKDQEFLMGHILPETQDPYYDKTKIENLRRKYAKVVFFPKEGLISDELRKKQVIDTAKLFGFSEDKIKKIEEALAKYETVDKAMEEIRKLQVNNTSNNSENFKKIIEEKKLEIHSL